MAVRIGIGLGRFSFGSTASFRKWLDECEASRIDSIWQSDQVITGQPFPEPLSLLATIAGATQRLKIGTNAVVLGFRDPLTFARQCASLDFLSDGRLLPTVGVGAGNAPGWAATGRDPKERGARANEILEIATRLWSGKSVDFAGRYYRIEGATIAPRPVQQPLPLWIGGSSAAAVRRTVRFGHGWLGGLEPPEKAGETVAAIRAEASAQGRAIPDDHFGATILYRLGTRRDASATRAAPPAGTDAALAARVQRMVVAGDAAHLIDVLRRYVAMGITKFVAVPSVRSEDELVEQTRLLEREVLPEAMALPG